MNSEFGEEGCSRIDKRKKVREEKRVFADWYWWQREPIASLSFQFCATLCLHRLRATSETISGRDAPFYERNIGRFIESH